tara:strand:+ start:1221 stop:1466 length:246 start_codon:yes stop_codon:yes gene_type:complete
MRSIATIGAVKGDRYLDITDYKRVLESMCAENGWEYNAFRDHIFFNEQCFNIKDRQELKSKLEKRKLPISKLKKYALEYEQ